MADVRSLLRNERAQRRINHPQASYSSTGTLECSVCHIPLKSDVEIWGNHLKSTQHAMRQERLRLSTSQRPKSTNLPERAGETSSREVSAGSKKRKADDGDDDSRKRTRPVVDVPGGFFDEVIEAKERGDAVAKPLEGFVRATGATPNLALVNPLTNPTIQPLVAPIDEDEWAAFERDVATPPPDPAAPSALTAAATISAAPMTAAELAAQSREQATMQGRERRDAEVEGEKEDAARALEVEFDEMEGLEERVRRLREKREKLRLPRTNEAEEGLINNGENGVEGRHAGEVEDDEESEDEDDDNEWGAWGR
ncbi:MAG: hypothetical protein Q9161_006425 [Pseudevernia consocians]